MDKLLSTTNLGYNLFYRILSPTIFISLATLVLYKIGLPHLTKNIWLVPAYFWAINLITLILMRRFPLVNKLLYLVIHISSIAIAFWVYDNALKYGPSAILPDPGNFRTEWWFIFFAYVYSLLNNFNPNYNAETQRRNKFISNRFKSLSKKYNRLLKKEFRNSKFLFKMFYSIMLVEDINRPPAARLLEKILFPFGFIKTTGIMQVTSDKLLTDSQSISKAQDIVLKSYKKHAPLTTYEYELVTKIAQDYNNGSYGINVGEYFMALENYLQK